MSLPPPLPSRPKRFRIYIAMLFGLCALYLFGIVNSSGSSSAVIQDLTPVRTIVFVVCSICFGTASILFLKKSRWGRPLVILGLVVHFAFMLHFNIKLLMKDGPPDPLATGGMVFGMVIFVGIFSLFGAIPFTRKFSDQLKKPETRIG